MAHRIFGFTDAKTTCECCGKENLKGTYAISIDGGEIVHFGSTCAFKKHGIKESELKSESKRVKFENEYMQKWGADNMIQAKINSLLADIERSNWFIDVFHAEHLKEATTEHEINSINESIKGCREMIKQNIEKIKSLQSQL